MGEENSGGQRVTAVKAACAELSRIWRQSALAVEIVASLSGRYINQHAVPLKRAKDRWVPIGNARPFDALTALLAVARWTEDSKTTTESFALYGNGLRRAALEPTPIGGMTSWRWAAAARRLGDARFWSDLPERLRRPEEPGGNSATRAACQAITRLDKEQPDVADMVRKAWKMEVGDLSETRDQDVPEAIRRGLAEIDWDDSARQLQDDVARADAALKTAAAKVTIRGGGFAWELVAQFLQIEHKPDWFAILSSE